MTIKTARSIQVETSQRKEFPFIAKPWRTSELSFRVSGPIAHFDVYAGNHYVQGETIAEIDARDFKLRHENAEAAYRRAEADYQRIEALYHKDNVSASSYEAARAAYIATKTSYEQAQNDLNDTRLQAPFDGYVGEVFIERYQDVKATEPVLTLTDISRLRIEIYVTQDIALQAEKLQQIDLIFDHWPDRVFHAEVVECARSTTPNNLSYLLTALLPNPKGELPAGLSGKVFFDLPGTQSHSVAIPQAALCHRPTLGDYVWQVDPETHQVSPRRIVVGELLPEGWIAVRSGLDANEMLATSSLRFLSEGMSVNLSDSLTTEPAQRP